MKNILIALLLSLFAVNAFAEDTVMKDEIVVLETNQGPIEIQLFAKVAPKACENFAGLVKRDIMMV